MLVVLYMAYIVVMYFNRYLECKITKFAEGLLQKCRKTDALEKGIVGSDEKQPLSGTVDVFYTVTREKKIKIERYYCHYDCFEVY